jgi:phytoene dehydrogenase-like protein
MSARVLVIGATPAGLTAAAYLARKANVAVLEGAPDEAATGPQSFAALDPQVIQELKLNKLGLRFAVRDLPLIALHPGVRLVLGRDLHEAHRSIAALSLADADRFVETRRALFAFARALRAIWWGEGAVVREADVAELRLWRARSASEWLENRFENEAVKAAFAFDALAAAPMAAGSALVFAWRAAQEMCGLQGAVAVPLGGPAALDKALTAAAKTAGAEIRSEAKVAKLLLAGDGVAGVELISGERLEADVVLSALPRQQTLLDLLPPGAAGFALAETLQRRDAVGEARLLLAPKALPPAFAAPGRYVLTERLESAVAAYGEAREGKLPAELALEILPLGETLLAVTVRPLPLAPAEPDFAAQLTRRVLHLLEPYAPELKAAAVTLKPPQGCAPVCVPHMLASWRERIATPVGGLFLCGEAAEPMPEVSLRAARIAARLAIRGGPP